MHTSNCMSIPARSTALASAGPSNAARCSPTIIRHRRLAPRSAVTEEATTAASGANGYQELKAETYLKETFWKSVPAEADTDKQLWEDDAVADAAPHSQLVDLNHAALGVQDVEGMIKFYTRVLGMRQLARPPFPFSGAWLQGGGLMLHLIEDDPTIPWKSEYTWKDAFVVDRPEPWYIRRGAHKAFEVASLEEAELRLKHFKIEYNKFLVPGTNAAQIFFYDPEGNGLEMGEGYQEIAASLKDKQPVQ